MQRERRSQRSKRIRPGDSPTSYDAGTAIMDDSTEKERQSGSGLRALVWPQNRWAVIVPLLAGLLLRSWWVWRFGMTTIDSRIYGEFARNVLEHHVYGYSNLLNGVLKPPTPTL